jgi:hypothetical protein
MNQYTLEYNVYQMDVKRILVLLFVQLDLVVDQLKVEIYFLMVLYQILRIDYHQYLIYHSLSMEVFLLKQLLLLIELVLQVQLKYENKIISYLLCMF